MSSDNHTSRNESPRRHPVATILLVAALIVGGLWIFGFIDAAISVNRGMNLWDYNQKKNSMNFISRSGMDFYLEHFTDFGNRKREVQDTFKGNAESVPPLNLRNNQDNC